MKERSAFIRLGDLAIDGVSLQWPEPLVQVSMWEDTLSRSSVVFHVGQYPFETVSDEQLLAAAPSRCSIAFRVEEYLFGVVWDVDWRTEGVGWQHTVLLVVVQQKGLYGVRGFTV
jgi:hypothetical protein